MPKQYSAQRSRAYFGILILAIIAGLTIVRVRSARETIETLTIVTRMHADGQASDLTLSNAQYHAGHAQRALDARWSLSGYMKHVVGAAIGLALIFVRRRSDAA
jgi:hypothetical protein